MNNQKEIETLAHEPTAWCIYLLIKFDHMTEYVWRFLENHIPRILLKNSEFHHLKIGGDQKCVYKCH